MQKQHCSDLLVKIIDSVRICTYFRIVEMLGLSVLKFTYMQQHANTTRRMTMTRTADKTAPPKLDTSTSSEWTSDVGCTSGANDPR